MNQLCLLPSNIKTVNTGYTTYHSTVSMIKSFMQTVCKKVTHMEEGGDDFYVLILKDNWHMESINNTMFLYDHKDRIRAMVSTLKHEGKDDVTSLYIIPRYQVEVSINAKDRTVVSGIIDSAKTKVQKTDSEVCGYTISKEFLPLHLDGANGPVCVSNQDLNASALNDYGCIMRYICVKYPHYAYWSEYWD